MAGMLVENLAAEWSPTKYTDDYRDNLMKVIRAKLKGRTPKLEETAEPHSAEVVDLMERLRRSLQGAGSTPAKTRPHARRTTHRAAKKAGSRSRKRTAA
jgi:DNA end-binding protein Ku